MLKGGRRFHKEDRRGEGQNWSSCWMGKDESEGGRMGLRMSPRDVGSRRRIGTSMLEQKVAKVTKGRAGSKAERDQGGKSRGRSDQGWRVSAGVRLLNGAVIVGSEKMYATSLGFL